MAWLLWSITIVITLMATIGFAALNVADTTAARGKIAADAAVLTTRIERLRRVFRAKTHRTKQPDRLADVPSFSVLLSRSD